LLISFFFFQAEDGIRDRNVTGVQTCALPILAIFQPHTFTRTKTFLQEFADSLNEADCVYLCDIFSSAREVSGDLTIDDLLDKIPNGRLLTLDKGDVLAKHKDAALVFVGAVDIQKLQKAYENSKNEHVK